MKYDRIGTFQTPSQLLHPISDLDFRGRGGRHLIGSLSADFRGLLLCEDTFSHKGVKQGLIAFRLRVRSQSLLTPIQRRAPTSAVHVLSSFSTPWFIWLKLSLNGGIRIQSPVKRVPTRCDMTKSLLRSCGVLVTNPQTNPVSFCGAYR